MLEFSIFKDRSKFVSSRNIERLPRSEEFSTDFELSVLFVELVVWRRRGGLDDVAQERFFFVLHNNFCVFRRIVEASPLFVQQGFILKFLYVNFSLKN